MQMMLKGRRDVENLSCKVLHTSMNTWNWTERVSNKWVRIQIKINFISFTFNDLGAMNCLKMFDSGIAMGINHHEHLGICLFNTS